MFARTGMVTRQACFRLLSIVCAATILCVVVATRTGAQEPSIAELQQQIAAQEQRLRALETQRLPPTDPPVDPDSKFAEQLTERVGTLEEEITGLHFVIPGTSKNTMKVSGRIHVDHWAFPDASRGASAFETGDPNISPQDRIGFRRMRLGVGGQVKDNMIYRLEMEFAGGNDTEFRDVYLGFEDVPLFHTVIIGNHKRPYGLDHRNSSRYNIFIERPFVIEAINQDARRVGISSTGVTEDESVNWQYGIFNQRLIQDEGLFVSDHYQLEGAGRFGNTWWYDETSNGRGYGYWALSGTLAHPDGSTNTPPPRTGFGRALNEARFRTRPEARSTSRWIDTGVIAGADWYEMLGVEGVLNFGPVQLVAEYQNLWMQRDAGFGRDLHFDGGYMYVSYFLTGEHMPWSRSSSTLGRPVPFENFWIVDTCRDGVRAGWGAWQVAARWSYANFTDANIAGGIGESVTLGLVWYWNPNASLQFNYIYSDIEARSPVAGLTSGHASIIGTRLRIDF